MQCEENCINKKTLFFKIEAASRATQTKWKIVNFKKKKKKPPAGQHKQKREIVIFQKKAARKATQTKMGNSEFSKQKNLYETNIEQN